MTSIERRCADAAGRVRERMLAGASVGEALRTFREDDELGAIGSMIAIRTVVPVRLAIAKQLVSEACGGKDYSHLALADLEQVVALDALPRVTGWIAHYAVDAVLERLPFMRIVRVEMEARCFQLASADGDGDGWRFGDLATFQQFRSEVQAAAAIDGWRDEIRILEDTPARLLFHFPRANTRP